MVCSTVRNEHTDQSWSLVITSGSGGRADGRGALARPCPASSARSRSSSLHAEIEATGKEQVRAVTSCMRS